MIEIVNPDEHGEQRPRGDPVWIEPPVAGIEGYENGADLAEHTWHRGTGPGEVVGFHEAVVVLRCHVHNEVGPVTSGVAFVGAGVAQRVVWARLGAVLPVETGGGIGCAAVRNVSICKRWDKWGGRSLQGKHPFQICKSLPVAFASTKHGCVVCSGAGAILKS